jgi:hypothetical protein
MFQQSLSRLWCVCGLQALAKVFEDASLSPRALIVLPDIDNVKRNIQELRMTSAVFRPPYTFEP